MLADSNSLPCGTIVFLGNLILRPLASENNNTATYGRFGTVGPRLMTIVATAFKKFSPD